MHPSVILTVASSSGGEHPLIDIDSTILIQLGAFLLLFVVARALLFKPYLNLRAARFDGIEGARIESERLRSEGEARLVEYERQLAAARARASTERQQIRNEAASQQREIAERSRAEANRAYQAAREVIDAESSAARNQLLARSDELARQIASKLLDMEIAP
jgi:F-type H+-transporting ATPase subunit b